MPEETKKRISNTGEYEMVEGEPRLDRERSRPITVPELENPNEIGSTTGVIRIRREDNDKTSQGDEDKPV